MSTETDDMDFCFRAAVDILRDCSCLMVLTGAGVSAESGVPTFRGKDGLWKQYRAEELATPQAFAKDPKLVWEWYSWRRKLIKDIEPNAGHYALAELEGYFEQFLLVTQNVDNLHSRAGSEKIVELHGNIFKEKCVSCKYRRWSENSYDEPPKCPECGALLRPGVVWFGEMLPQKAVKESWDFASKAQCAIVAGTSSIVYPAAQLPHIVIENGGKIIEINPNRTPLSPMADVVIPRKSAETLSKLINLLKQT